jgi:hypothetical protein
VQLRKCFFGCQMLPALSVPPPPTCLLSPLPPSHPPPLPLAAPITAGNFVAKVAAGAYNGVRVGSSNVSLLVSSMQSTASAPLPLEIFPAGDFEPEYRAPLDVRSGEMPVSERGWGCMRISTKSFGSGGGWGLGSRSKR